MKGIIEIKSYSRKQAGVIFRNVKTGTIKMDKADINRMYEFASEFKSDGICVPSKKVEVADTIAAMVAHIREAVDAIFADDAEKAQQHVDMFATLGASLN